MPDATASISAERDPIVVQPPTNNTPEPTVKRSMKQKVFVLVPPAPYSLSGQGRRSHRSRASSSISPVTVNKPESTSQVDSNVLKAPSIASTPSLSDIGISIPTTVRKPGTYIMHTVPHVIPQITEHLVEPVNPRTKPPHVGNPVTAQVITKGSIATLKFKKSKVKPTPSSSNNTTIVASTDTQGGLKSPNLPQSQPTSPMPLPEVSSSFTELTMQSIVEKFFDYVVSSYCNLFFKWWPIIALIVWTTYGFVNQQ